MAYRLERTTVKATRPKYKSKEGHPLTIVHCNTWMDYIDAVRVSTVNCSAKLAESERLQVEKTIAKSLKPNPDFAEKLRKMRAKIRQLISTKHHENVWHYAVKGSRYDMGRVIAGLPDCALARIKRPAHKTITMLFSPEHQCDTHPDAVVIRAAAIAEVCDLLQRNQIRTEIITGFETTRYVKPGSIGYHYESWIKIKQMNANLNLAALYFPFQCSSDFLSILERSLIYDLLKTHSMHYSSGMTAPADIVLADGSYDSTSKHFSSPEAATQWANDLFESLTKMDRKPTAGD